MPSPSSSPRPSTSFPALRDAVASPQFGSPWQPWPEDGRLSSIPRSPNLGGGGGGPSQLGPAIGMSTSPRLTLSDVRAPHARGSLAASGGRHSAQSSAHNSNGGIDVHFDPPGVPVQGSSVHTPSASIDFEQHLQGSPSKPSYSSPSSRRPNRAKSAGFSRAARRTISRRMIIAGLVGVAIVLTVASRLWKRRPVVLEEDAEGRPVSLRVREERLGSLAYTERERELHDAWLRVRDGEILEVREAAKPFNDMDVMNYAEPQDTMRSQLKQGVRYVTGMAYGGHANQFIALFRLLYIAKITERVAVITTLLPLHFDGPPMDFSDFFDLRLFRALSNIPAVEMSALKKFDLTGQMPQNEEISCWSVQEATTGGANVGAASMDVHGIWVHHWPLPKMARAMGGFDLSYDAIRIFDYDWWGRQAWIEKVRKDNIPQKGLEGRDPATVDALKNFKDGFDPHKTAPVADQIVCWDNTLFLGPLMFPDAYTTTPAVEPQVPGEEFAWSEAGQYIRFNERIEALADTYIADMFGEERIEDVPPFLTVHLRRGDFKEFAGLTALEKYVGGVERVRKRLQQRLDNPRGFRGPGRKAFYSRGVEFAEEFDVVVTTDEKDPTFIADLKAMGWKVLDHDRMQTEKKYGGWYPTMLDGAILARGMGFVGTDRSTFSHLAGLRVKYWNGGVVEIAR